jgi:hypothetical protein
VPVKDQGVGTPERIDHMLVFMDPVSLLVYRQQMFGLSLLLHWPNLEPDTVQMF